MKPLRFETSVAWSRARTTKRLSLAAKTAFAFAMLANASLMVVDAPQLMMGFYGAAWITTVALVVATCAVWLTRKMRAATIEVAEDLLHVRYPNATRSFGAKDIVSAYVVHRRQYGWTVEIELSGEDLVVVRTSDEATARALVDALDFGTSGRRVTVHLATPARRLLHLVYAWAGYWVGSMLGGLVTAVTAAFGTPIAFLGAAATLALTALVYGLAKRLFAPPSVTIGEDGVVVASGGRERFIPRSDLGPVLRGHGGLPLGLTTKAGASITFVGSGIDPERRGALAELADMRLGATSTTPERGDLFERGDRPVSDWRKHIASLFEDSGYRSAGMTPEQTTAVLRSPAATPQQRIGAAMALRIAGEPAERIRIAAEAAADPAMREALEAVAEDAPPERLEKAMRKLR